MRFRTALVAMTALAAMTAAQPVAAQSISRRMELLKLEQEAAETVGALVDSDFRDCEARLPALRTIMNDPRFDRLRVEVRRPFLFSVIVCAEVKDRPLGLAAALKLEPLATEPAEIGAVQTIQISDALERHAMVDATRRFLKLLDAQPEAAALWRPGMIGAFTDYLEEDPDLALTALQRITSFAWRDPDSLRARNNEWALAYGWQLGDRGRSADAAKAMAQADDSRVMMYVAADRRFSALWSDSRRFDWTAVVQAELTRAEADMAAAPSKLRPARDMISALRSLARYDEAIQIGQAFRARLQDGETFEDRDTEADGLLVQLGHILFDAGEVKEAEAVLLEALALDGPDAPATDARMGYSSRLLDLGQPAEALKVLAGIDPDYLTPYGEAWVDSQRTCAQADTDPKAALVTLATLEARKSENPGALSQALICLNRLDEAAALMIWRLQTPSHRSGALDPFWVARAPPVIQPWQARFEARRQQILARADVRAALDKVGRPVTTPLAGDFWGGF